MKKQIKVPKQFELAGRTIKVEFTDKFNNIDDQIGIADYCQNKIVILKGTYKKLLDNENKFFYSKEFHYPNKEYLLKDESQYVYLHELIHWILYVMGNPLHKNEGFVTMFAELLKQAIVTAK